MGLSCTASEINGDFSQRSHIFAPPRCTPLELGNTGWPQESRMMNYYQAEKEFDEILSVWIQCANVTDGRTDGRTPADS